MTTTVVLTVEDCASELGLESLGVHRLIAREVLPATFVGDEERGGYRITRQSLETFVAKRAPDVKRHSINSGTGWFAFEMDTMARDFRQAIIQAANAQRLSDAQFEDRLPNLKMRRMEVVLEYSTAIKQIVNEPAESRRIVRIRNAEALPFAKFGEIYLAERLQAFAKQECQRDRPLHVLDRRRAVDRFYASPKRYTEILAVASQQVRDSLISFEEKRPTKLYSDRPVTINYRLPVSTFARPELLEAIAVFLF